jgi:hypothetical protein
MRRLPRELMNCYVENPRQAQSELVQDSPHAYLVFDYGRVRKQSDPIHHPEGENHDFNGPLR